MVMSLSLDTLNISNRIFDIVLKTHNPKLIRPSLTLLTKLNSVGNYKSNVFNTKL